MNVVGQDIFIEIIIFLSPPLLLLPSFSTSTSQLRLFDRPRGCHSPTVIISEHILGRRLLQFDDLLRFELGTLIIGKRTKWIKSEIGHKIAAILHSWEAETVRILNISDVTIFA